MSAIETMSSQAKDAWLDFFLIIKNTFQLCSYAKFGYFATGIIHLLINKTLFGIMKKIYLFLLCFLVLASCKPRLITQGIKDKTSNYVVTTDGKQIDVPSSGMNLTNIQVGTQSFPATSLSAIKAGEAYYGVKGGTLYDGIYYGKIMLLRRLVGTSITRSATNTTSSPIYNYYLQKQGKADIVDLTGKNLVNYVQDNPLALRKAQASRIYSTVSMVSTFTFIAGVACVFLPYSSPLRKPAVTLGLFSLPVAFITGPIGRHKKFKAIRVYNGY